VEQGKKLAYAVLDRIDEHPEEHVQSHWLCRSNAGVGGCFAGLACLLSGDTPIFVVWQWTIWTQPADADQIEVPVRAAWLLELDNVWSERFFSTELTASQLRDMVLYYYGPREDEASEDS
jgi:hypothetical protein